MVTLSAVDWVTRYDGDEEGREERRIEKKSEKNNDGNATASRGDGRKKWSD